jgi:hypothetical protein
MKRLGMLLGCLAWLAGCASVHKYDLKAQPPRVGVDGFATVVDGERLNLRRARNYYNDSGAYEAEKAMNEGIHAYLYGKAWFPKDVVIGALLGALAVGAIWIADGADGKRPADWYASSGAYFGAIGLTVLSVPIGIMHGNTAKLDALPLIRKAADIYNAGLTATAK